MSIDLLGMLTQFKKVDSKKVDNDEVPDGTINISFIENFSDSKINKARNTEFDAAHKIVSETFSIKSYGVVETILKYLDQLDGKYDKLIQINKVENFVVALASEGEEKDMFIYYIQSELKKSLEFKNEIDRHQNHNKEFQDEISQRITDLETVLGNFKSIDNCSML